MGDQNTLRGGSLLKRAATPRYGDGDARVPRRRGRQPDRLESALANHDDKWHGTFAGFYLQDEWRTVRAADTEFRRCASIC